MAAGAARFGLEPFAGERKREAGGGAIGVRRGRERLREAKKNLLCFFFCERLRVRDRERKISPLRGFGSEKKIIFLHKLCFSRALSAHARVFSTRAFRTWCSSQQATVTTKATESESRAKATKEESRLSVFHRGRRCEEKATLFVFVLGSENVSSLRHDLAVAVHQIPRLSLN